MSIASRAEEHTADFLVVGAGIAGASVAAELSAFAQVILLDMEAQPGYHATGRSAAFFAPSYGNQIVRNISAACEGFYHSPPPGFSDTPLIRTRDCIFFGREDQVSDLTALKTASPQLRSIPMEELTQSVPILAAPRISAALLDAGGGDLDVDAVLQAYIRLFRKNGGALHTQQQVAAINHKQGRWQVECSAETFTAPTVVNAAGAWADTVAEMAGLPGLSLTPMRRTMVLIDAPAGMDIDQWPLLVDASEEFYFKPDAGRLLISPADETPSPPCDAQAEELDVAIAIDRFQRATGVEPKQVRHRWAGLRTFASDRNYVVGMDPRAQGFFWLAGQGGTGVQSAPGLAKLGMHLLTDGELAAEFSPLLEFKNELAPGRLISDGTVKDQTVGASSL